MILQPSHVELTKVHYYDENTVQRIRNNADINTISGTMLGSSFKKHNIIKKNIFGHKWVLKVNEAETGNLKEKTKWKIVVYVLVFACIVVAVCFGIYFSIENKSESVDFIYDNLPEDSGNIQNQATTVAPVTYNSIPTTWSTTEPGSKSTITTVENTKYTPHITITPKSHTSICGDCKLNRTICLKISETDLPKCLTPVDRKDPTGCGGLCKINTQYCKLLDIETGLRQCIDVRNILICRKNNFNCGNMCIPLKKRCDGIFHCSNYSDEKNCTCDLTTHFQCGYATSCLEKHKKCDGNVDCWDKSDERNCGKRCGTDEIPCTSGQCIKKDQFCDGSSDCKDETDEPQGCRK